MIISKMLIIFLLGFGTGIYDEKVRQDKEVNNNSIETTVLKND